MDWKKQRGQINVKKGFNLCSLFPVRSWTKKLAKKFPVGVFFQLWAEVTNVFKTIKLLLFWKIFLMGMGYLDYLVFCCLNMRMEIVQVPTWIFVVVRWEFNFVYYFRNTYFFVCSWSYMCVCVYKIQFFWNTFFKKPTFIVSVCTGVF